MSTEVIVRIVPGGLRCVNEAEAGKLQDLLGREVMATIRQPRNIGFHRRFFAMLDASLRMADLEVNAEQWRAMVTVGAGWCDFVPRKDADGFIAVPRSWSFSRMDETEFKRLYEAAITFICANYLQGATPEELAAEAEFLGFL